MSSTIKVNNIQNLAGDDSGIDLSTNDQIILKTANTTALTIDSSQNVGIGETSPLGKLHIRSSDASITSVNANSDELVLENNGTCGISIASATDSTGNISFIDSGDTNQGRIQYDHSTNNMIFRVNDAESMRILSGGNLSIGLTTSLGKLHVASDGSATTPCFFQDTRTGSTSTTCVVINRNGSNVGAINTTNTSTAYVTSSDHRLKENVEDMTGAIDRVKQLLPKRFNFIADADTTVDGFLAHEAQSVVAEAVTGTHNEVDDDGEAVMQGIDQAKLVPLLTGALKEAIAKIEALETRITALESE